jgi:hypothetical protein
MLEALFRRGQKTSLRRASFKEISGGATLPPASAILKFPAPDRAFSRDARRALLEFLIDELRGLIIVGQKKGRQREPIVAPENWTKNRG